MHSLLVCLFPVVVCLFSRLSFWVALSQVSSQMEKKTKVTIKRKTYFDEQDSDDNDDDMM